MNADIAVGQIGNVQGTNMFAYCFNNPVNMQDDSGIWPKWIKKAVAVVATVATVATFGAGSVAGVAMITATATFAARATEVTALQVKKGKEEGKSGGQIVKDTMESLYDNGSKIIGWTPATKVAGIAATHSTHTIVAEAFGEKMTLSRTLEYPGGKILPYVFVALAWSDTIISVFSEDPVTRANERGYVLK